VPYARGPQIPQDLREVLLRQAADRLDLNDQKSLHHKIGVIIAEPGAVLIQDLQRELLLHDEPLPTQSTGEAVLVHLFQMPVPKIPVHRKSGLAEHIAQTQHGVGLGGRGIHRRSDAGDRPLDQRPAGLKVQGKKPA